MSKTQKVALVLTGAAALPGRVLAVTGENVSINSTKYPYIANITPTRYVTAAINILLGAAGIAAFIFLLWGGIQWILAGGDKEGTEKARKKIPNALIGLAVVFSAYALLYIIRVLFNVDVISLNLNNI